MPSEEIMDIKDLSILDDSRGLIDRFSTSCSMLVLPVVGALDKYRVFPHNYLSWIKH